MICAYGNKSGSCKGDSGGPVVTLENNLYYSVIGVVSFGYWCKSRIGKWDFFARVTHRLDWIESHLQGQRCEVPQASKPKQNDLGLESDVLNIITSLLRIKKKVLTSLNPETKEKIRKTFLDL